MRVYPRRQINNENFTNYEWIRWDDVWADCVHCGSRKSYDSQHLRLFKSCGCLRNKRAKPPPARVDGDIAYIKLTGGLETIVDAQFAGIVSASMWIAAGDKPKMYAQRGGLRDRGVYLHRLLMNAPEDMFVDHINGDRLDNRLCNLRLCTKSENGRNSVKPKSNTSGLKGVSWHRKSKKWVAQIMINQKQIYLGLHKTKEDAHAAYVEASRKYHGEFGRVE